MSVALVAVVVSFQLSVPPRNRPPSITGELPALPTFAGNEEVRFTLTIDDPDHDLVNLRLVSPTTAIEFLPVVNATPPVRREVRWIPDGYGAREIVFEAFDARKPSVRTRWSRRPHVGGYVRPQQVAAAGLDGDDRWSIVGVASGADVGTALDAGSAYLWTLDNPFGGERPLPRATLQRPSPAPAEQVGGGVTPLHFHDVDRDGIEDVVLIGTYASANGISRVGTVEVWRGGPDLHGTPLPWVEFSNSAGTAGDGLGLASGDAVLFEEVTGDGVPDLVVATFNSAAGGKAQAGRVFVFQGGPAANAHPDPWAILERSSPSMSDRIGLAGDNTQAVQVADVTGDGIADVIVGSRSAQIGTATQAGAVFVWQGGTSLVNTVAPLAVLHLTNPTAGDSLTGASRGLQLADVSGDGVLDIVAASPYVDVGGVVDAGAVAVWLGGATLTGSPPPDALLTIPNPHKSDLLCSQAGSGLGWFALKLEDLNGDGLRDVIASTPFCDEGGKVDVGAIYVWLGGSSLAGATAPDAILTGTGSKAGDQFAWAGYSVLADVTGDGWRDLVAWCPLSADRGVPLAGVVHVFEGGPSLGGNTTSAARLGLASPQFNGFLSVGPVVDVTGDGIADVVAPAESRDRGASDVGSVFVFQGGTSLRGTVTESAELRDPHPNGLDRFGSETRVADVTGDGVRDVICGTLNDRVPAGQRIGSATVFAGGAALNGLPAEFAYLHPPAPYLTAKRLRAALRSLQDWDGDGRLDVLLTSTQEKGASFVWLGGAAISGEPPPVAILESGKRHDHFGSAGFTPFVAPSRTTTERILVIGAMYGDVGAVDTGLVKTFQLRQGVLEQTLLAVPGARPFDRLGY